MSKDQPKHHYIAFDSSELRNLAIFEEMYIRDPALTIDAFDKSCFSTLIKYFSYYRNVIQLIRAGTIRPMVTVTAFNECSFLPVVQNFIKKYCYFSKKQIENPKEARDAVEELANAYVSPYVKSDGQSFPPSMDKVYSAIAGKRGSSNKAFTMAEATYEGVCLCTNAAKDYINFNDQKRDGARRQGIIYINRSKGYKRDGLENDNFVPVPYTLPEFINRIKNRSESEIFLGYDDSKVKVSDHPELFNM